MWDHWTSRPDLGLGLYSFDYLILLSEKFLNDFEYYRLFIHSLYDTNTSKDLSEIGEIVSSEEFL